MWETVIFWARLITLLGIIGSLIIPLIIFWRTPAPKPVEDIFKRTLELSLGIYAIVELINALRAGY
jgi:hypothetical protein